MSHTDDVQASILLGKRVGTATVDEVQIAKVGALREREQPTDDLRPDPEGVHTD